MNREMIECSLRNWGLKLSYIRARDGQQALGALKSRHSQ